MRVLVGVCACIAVLGGIDDLRPLPAAIRFLLQTLAAVALLLFAGVPALLLDRVMDPVASPIVVGLLLVIWMVGVLNIYNFMDGMDGLAGSQAVAASIALAILFAGSPLAIFPIALAAASIGFLAHNVPPARLFMGDAGSTFIGMAFSGLAISAMRQGIPITESALALAPFLLDGTFTIFRRLRRGEKIWQAHRSHLYQRAVQTGLTHRRVLVVYIAWMIACVFGAVAASRVPLGWIAGWAIALLGLVIVWRWVLHRESKKPAAA
jgi:UDP-N-acetylmuramyl pentapeptide phosphotransferase/UDP-N-acetylglucosamine-1-phosphate transferase